jgi:hypothetical protein
MRERERENLFQNRHITHGIMWFNDENANCKNNNVHKGCNKGFSKRQQWPKIKNSTNTCTTETKVEIFLLNFFFLLSFILFVLFPFACLPFFFGNLVDGVGCVAYAAQLNNFGLQLGDASVQSSGPCPMLALNLKRERKEKKERRKVSCSAWTNPPPFPSLSHTKGFIVSQRGGETKGLLVFWWS